MTELLTAGEMRSLERAAIEGGSVTGLELMERAGRGVVEAMLDWRPSLATTSHRALVLAGPGNNGGDGFVVARLLSERGWDVDVRLLGHVERLPPDAAENARRWREHGPVRGLDEGASGRQDVVVDALFGAGLTRPLDRDLVARCRALADPEADVVAVDSLSGLCMDSGRVLGSDTVLPAAGLTATFHRMRPGHFLAEGAERSGRVTCVDIGLSGPENAGIRLVSRPAGEAIDKCAAGHKYDHGHALILSGGVGRGGAARLAARGALRIGAGLVTLGCPPAALIENAAHLDAIMLRPVDGADGLSGLDVMERLTAVGLGFGFGGGERARAMVHAVCSNGLPVVLDADALTSFEDDPETLFSLLHEDCVITPHPGEFRRLFPDIAQRLSGAAEAGPAYSKVDATREAARRAGCVVVHKGGDSVIAAPDGRAAVHFASGAHWLATAGTGDVLAGMVAGLLARGLAPMDAACHATWLHAQAARRFGPGLIAKDLPETLPAVLRDLLA